MNIKNYIWRNINSFQQSAKLSNRMRNVLLRLFKTQIDKSARIAEGTYIGSNSLVMGKETFVNVNSFLDGNAPIIIEDYSRCGPYTKILTGTHTYRHSVIRRHPEDKTIAKSVRIKRGSWIGMGSLILPGVTIAEGCIIGAGSVVIKNTEPNGLYAGNPAKRVKDLPTTEDLNAEVEKYFNLI